jgi:hypothetical protein
LLPILFADEARPQVSATVPAAGAIPAQAEPGASPLPDEERMATWNPSAASRFADTAPADD